MWRKNAHGPRLWIQHQHATTTIHRDIKHRLVDALPWITYRMFTDAQLLWACHDGFQLASRRVDLDARYAFLRCNEPAVGKPRYMRRIATAEKIGDG